MRWRILSKISSKERDERREEVVTALFKNRGLVTKRQREEFLDPKNPSGLTPKDVGLSLVQITKAVKRIRQAVRKKEKIIVYGDYDTDGVCATAIMWEAIFSLGGQVMPFIPKRDEGYGLKVDRIDKMAKEGVRLIVTVDQGIVHSRQVAHAKKAGVDVIVTDHHEPREKKPKAVAIVQTTKLAGCGVAWFLARELGGKNGLDLAAIGTVTDMVPLLGPNRSIVKFGLEALKKTKRPGLLSLLELAGVEKEKIGMYEVGFILGPRLNASGRMEDPIDALRLVCTKDEGRALVLAEQVDRKNRERQGLTQQTVDHAREIWQKEEQKSLIFIHHRSFEHGVIGLVASKLKDEFYRPAVVLAPRADHWVASARSIEEFNIIEAIRTCADILSDHGGHKLAAGFSVAPEKIEEMRERLVGMAEEKLEKEKLSRILKVDAEVDLADLNLELLSEIEKFAPFGQKNREPVFATRGVEVVESRTVGRDQKHLKLRVKGQISRQKPRGHLGGLANVEFDAIAFGRGYLHDQLSPGKPVDIAYNLVLNEWNGRKGLQLKVRDIRI